MVKTTYHTEKKVAAGKLGARAHTNALITAGSWRKGASGAPGTRATATRPNGFPIVVAVPGFSQTHPRAWTKAEEIYVE